MSLSSAFIVFFSPHRLCYWYSLQILIYLEFSPFLRVAIHWLLDFRFLTRLGGLVLVVWLDFLFGRKLFLIFRGPHSDMELLPSCFLVVFLHPAHNFITSIHIRVGIAICATDDSKTNAHLEEQHSSKTETTCFIQVLCALESCKTTIQNACVLNKFLGSTPLLHPGRMIEWSITLNASRQ